MATNWRVYGRDTVASQLARCDLPGFFQKKAVVGPGEAAIIVRDGEVYDIFTESKVIVQTCWTSFSVCFEPVPK